MANVIPILDGETPFFAEMARQHGRTLDQLLEAIAEQVAEADRYTPPCVGFDDAGHVRRLDLGAFPSLSLFREGVRVDCSPLARLEELCIFDREVELVAVNNTRLTSVEIAFCGQRRLEFPAGIEHLDCTGNPLAEFAAERFPKLKTLKCGYTPLESLDVSALRELEELECGYNDNSHYRKGWPGPRLTKLVLGENTNLKRVNALNWLYPGTPSGQRLRELDVSGLPNLEELFVANCELRALDLHNNGKLRSLNCSDNPLERLDLPSTSTLESLAVAGTRLESLDLAGQRALTALSCGGNALKHLELASASALLTLSCGGAPIVDLDLSAQTELKRLNLAKCAVRSLDLTSARELREVTLSGCRKLREIRCSERQKQAIAGLRAFFKLSKATKNPAKMDAFMLHEFVRHYNWDFGTKELFKAIRNPNCSLASALTVYWRARPHWYLQYPDDEAALKDVTGREVLPLIREIEKRAREGAYAHHEHIGWSAEYWTNDPYPNKPKLRSIPEYMLHLSVDHVVE